MNDTIDTTQYLQNHRGHLVPLSQISEVDLMRNALVNDLIDEAKEQAEQVREKKLHSMSEIKAFMTLSSEKYGVDIGGDKGNVTLTTYDGNRKIQLVMADIIEFDERLAVARTLIMECVEEWSEGAKPEAITLIKNAFAPDSNGMVSTGKILALRKLNIEHKKWHQAMQAIVDSIQVTSTKPYIRFYEKDETGKHQQIVLDPKNL